MFDARARDRVSATAHLTASVRALGRITDGDAANADYLAQHFLLPHQRLMTRAPRFSRWFLERFMPGGFGYFNARTRYFDELLLQQAAAGLDQLVLLGAGFDTRPQRFAKQLGEARVFEVDVPKVLSIRERCLRAAGQRSCATAVPIDFERDNLVDVLRAHGFAMSGARSFFLWEGVTFYLHVAAVTEVLAAVAALSTAGSSLAFDYATRAFFEGDHSGYGAAQLAYGWRSMGNVHRSGIANVAALVQPHGFRVLNDLDPETLEQRYLMQLAGGPCKAWGVMRIAHVERE